MHTVLHATDLHIDGPFECTVENLVNKQHPDMLVQPPNATNETRRKLKFAHQLDFATSGILCLAFTRKSCAAIGTCFQNRKACKLYLAVLEGHLNPPMANRKLEHAQVEPLLVKSFIGTDPADITKFKMASVAHKDILKDGRLAETQIFVISHGKLQDRNVTKVLLKPTSGRRHQLRLHTKQLGHPIVGDVTYSSDHVWSALAPRMCLHAWKLMLPFEDHNWHINTSDPFLFESTTRLFADVEQVSKSILPVPAAKWVMVIPTPPAQPSL